MRGADSESHALRQPSEAVRAELAHVRAHRAARPLRDEHLLSHERADHAREEARGELAHRTVRGAPGRGEGRVVEPDHRVPGLRIEGDDLEPPEAPDEAL